MEIDEMIHMAILQIIRQKIVNHGMRIKKIEKNLMDKRLDAKS